MYAVNVADLSGLDKAGPLSMASLLLVDFVGKPLASVCIDRTRFDTDAVVLDGPAGADIERVEALVKFLQTVVGPKFLHRRVRCYRQGSQGGWREIRPEGKPVVIEDEETDV
jgi:hypothetical protein